MPAATVSSDVCGQYTEMLFAAQRRRLVWIGLARVSEASGLKMVGWYETTQQASFAMASSATAVVRLWHIRSVVERGG